MGRVRGATFLNGVTMWHTVNFLLSQIFGKQKTFLSKAERIALHFEY